VYLDSAGRFQLALAKPIRKIKPLKYAGLFAGIGGFELGFSGSKYTCVLLCEKDRYANAVLRHRFPEVAIHQDITTLNELPAVDVVTAGFPCQDLSQVGACRGIDGPNSSLVEHVFRLVEGMKVSPTWVVLENVPFMLTLGRGEAMTRVVDRLERLGFLWAYRVVDSHAFGVPQRRRRVIFVASKVRDPRAALFDNDERWPIGPSPDSAARGFYWTEGNTGVGWAVDSIPTLKGGSRLSIPSPPAIWNRADGEIGTPDIRDTERLQGFPSGWTSPAEKVDKFGSRARWRLVGNAVSVPVARWLASRLAIEFVSTPSRADTALSESAGWPSAAWGVRGHRYSVAIGAAPVARKITSLIDFLRHPLKPLSLRAATGFLGRAENSNLTFEAGFLDAMKTHIAKVRMA
jgi:DNA (cytosine-5)-methyltransferase 1